MVASGTTEEILSGDAAGSATAVSEPKRAARGVETKVKPRRLTFQLAEAHSDLNWLVQALREDLSSPALELNPARPGWWELSNADITPALVARLTAKLAERSILVRSIEVDRRSLEDVFLDITGRDMR